MWEALVVALVAAFVAIVLLVAWSCCVASGRRDQWDEDHYGIRRS